MYTLINIHHFSVEEPIPKENPKMELEYWSHHQLLDVVKTTTTTSVTLGEESKIPTLKKDVNSTIVTSSGQPVYLHCLVENLGERSVSTLGL